VAGTEETVQSEMLRIAHEQTPDQQQNSLHAQRELPYQHHHHQQQHNVSTPNWWHIKLENWLL